MKQRRNLFALFLLFVLMVDVKRCKAQGIKISSNSSKKPEDYAARIMELNQYLGTLAHTELRFLDPEQVIKGRDRLVELTNKYPNYPHAFIRLWIYDYSSGNITHSLEAIEPLYTNYSDFYTVPEMYTMIVNLYSQSLFQ